MHSTEGEIRDYAWSPGGGYLAFSMNDERRAFGALYLVDEGRQAASRDQRVCSTTIRRPGIPAAIIFTSCPITNSSPRSRKSNLTSPPIAARGIFVMALRKDVKNPFPPESDEVTIKDAAKDANDKDKGKEEKDKKAEAAQPEPKDGGIDFDGIEPARGARSAGRGKLFRPDGDQRCADLCRRARALLRPVRGHQDFPAHLHLQRPERDHAGRRHRRLRCLARWVESAGPPGTGLERVRRHTHRRKHQEDRFHCRVDAGKEPGRGVERDLQRSLAALPRFLLRAQYARLRLGGAAPAL